MHVEWILTFLVGLWFHCIFFPGNFVFLVPWLNGDCWSDGILRLIYPRPLFYVKWLNSFLRVMQCSFMVLNLLSANLYSNGQLHCLEFFSCLPLPLACLVVLYCCHFPFCRPWCSHCTNFPLSQMSKQQYHKSHHITSYTSLGHSAIVPQNP